MSFGLRLVAVAVVATACTTWSTAASGAALQPANLRVLGGEESWRANSRFQLHWDNPPGVAAVHYRLLAPDGQTPIDEGGSPWAASSIDSLTVPTVPGLYTAEVRLEDAFGVDGPAATVALRFDNAPPGAVAPRTSPGWLGRTDFPFPIRLSRPTDPQPLSGIRGYAVSTDTSPHGAPCAGAVCTATETDLQDGISGDTIALGELPEGTGYVHAVAVSGSGVASATVGTAILRVDKTDPETSISGVPAGWTDTPVTVTAHAGDGASGMAAAGPGGPFTAIRIDGGAPILAAGDAVATTVISSGVHTVAWYARDAAGNVNDGSVSNGLPNRAPRTAVVRIDREPPAVVFAPAQDPADPELIVARASDTASGLDPGRGTIAVRRVGSDEPFRELATRGEGGTLRARWDSASGPAGEYELRATAFDLAGNVAVSTGRSGGAPMRLRAPLKPALRIEVDTESGGAPHGRRAWFGGRLVAGRRSPAAHVPVRVIERFAAGSTTSERVTTIRTGTDGRFGLRLPTGPSREVLAEVAATPTTRAASSPPVTLAVEGQVSLKVSSRVARIGGRPIVLRGRVGMTGARLPAEGKAIELQFRLPGRPWSEFRTVRTDRRGRFRLAYRFSDDDSRGVRFRFRAYAPAQSGWPFEPAGSRPVAVAGV